MHTSSNPKKPIFHRIVLTYIVAICFYAAALSQNPYNPKYLNAFKSIGGKALTDIQSRTSKALSIYDLPLASASQSGFVAEIHADTATFTPVPYNFPGVIGGVASWFDFDNDGDMDILLSGYTDSTLERIIMKVYRKEGGTYVEASGALPIVIQADGISWGDYDNDGDFDLLLNGRMDVHSTQPACKVFRNDNGVFVDAEIPLMGLFGNTAKWVDYDGDGDLDIFITGSPDVGNTFYSKLYRNDEGVFTEVDTGIQGVWGSSAAWGDYDNDGDLDLLLTGYGWGVHTILYRNDGGVFTDTHTPLQEVNSSAVAFFDCDNDGDLDILLTGVASGDVPIAKIYRNDSGGTFTDINAALQGASVSAVAVGDYDNDGDLDIAISGAESFWSGANPTTKIYRNDNGAFVDIHADLAGTWSGSLEWGDYDNDGKLDLFVTGGTVGRPYYEYPGPYYPVATIYHNNGGGWDTPPDPPSAMSVLGSTANVQFAWNNGVDDKTPSKAISYNLRVGTAPGANDIVAPEVNTSTGYIRAPHVGNIRGRTTWNKKGLSYGTYYWSIQAVDNGYKGSSFTSEQTFTLAPPQESRWHLVSLPSTCTDYHKSILFPSASSRAFSFDPLAGYQAKDVMENGPGYWLNFPANATHLVPDGAVISSMTISVKQGWNLVGSIATQIQAADIVSAPAAMVTSQFFGYDGRYEAASTIEPGKGYWVKASEDGQFTLSAASAPGAKGRISIVPDAEMPPAVPRDDAATAPSALPSAFGLGQNYPNPFNPRTIIGYDLPEGSHVLLKVYDVLGRDIKTLVDEFQSPGYKSVTLDAADLPTGLYYYRVTAGKFNEIKKMILVK